MPVTAERADELDDDPGDEQQPEDEQRKPKDLKEQHQLNSPDLTDEMSSAAGLRGACQRTDSGARPTSQPAQPPGTTGTAPPTQGYR
ncbi:hypothetical protein MPRS_11160 [Mycobacterium paraseoulense]|nr:hypothetical protein MPRS_11160 [Mycobacterium paraseoulense]